jgi:hypothetical protein
MALTAVTRAGAGGAYAFIFGSLFVFCIFLLWPDLRARIAGNRSSSRPDMSDRRVRTRQHLG